MTKSTNEAEGDQTAQPRSSFSLDTEMDRGIAARSRPGNWSRVGFRVVFVPVFALIIVGFAVRTAPNVLDAPRPLPPDADIRSDRPFPEKGSESLRALEFKGLTTPSKGSDPFFGKSRSKSSISASPVKLDEPVIRVNLTPGGVSSFLLDVRGRVHVTSLETGETSPEKFEHGVITVSATKTGLKLGSREFATSQLEIAPEQPGTIRLSGSLYRGKMRLFRRSDGKVLAVNVLPIEEYLASVVDSEMPAKFPEAARKAQAIVARTYALFQMQQADPHSVFDLVSSQQSQKYLGVEYVDRRGRHLAGESESSRRVVKETRGIVCQRDGKLFCSYYSAVCGGQTTNGLTVIKDAIDAVKTVSCDWCRDSPHYRWETEISREDFQKRAFRCGKDGNQVIIQSIHQVVEPGEGSISQFEFSDGKRQRKISGVELRERLPSGTLFSPHFQIKLEKDRVVFQGRGHGHGVGFCQWGAKGQAEAGRNCLEIVRHYFPDVELTTLDY